MFCPEQIINQVCNKQDLLPPCRQTLSNSGNRRWCSLQHLFLAAIQLHLHTRVYRRLGETLCCCLCLRTNIYYELHLV